MSHLPHQLAEPFLPSHSRLRLPSSFWAAGLRHLGFDPLRHVPTNVHRSMGTGIVRFSKRENDFSDLDAIHEVTHFFNLQLFDPTVSSSPSIAQRLFALMTDESKHKETYEMGKFFKDDPDDIALTSDVPKHKEFPRMFAPGFSINYLANLELVMRKVFHNFESAPTAFGQFFDMVYAPDHPYQTTIKSIMSVSPSPPQADHVKNCVESRRASMVAGEAHAQDILQIILDHRDGTTGEPITNKEIGVRARIFLLAGSETTSNMMGSMLLFLLKNPAALDRPRKELDASTVRTDIELPEKGHDGKARTVFIPKGTVIRANAYVAQRNPSEEEAFTFSPSDRKEEVAGDIVAEHDGPGMLNQRAFMPFSVGSRWDCLRRNFAWNKIGIVLGHLLRRFDVIPQFDVNDTIEGKEFGMLSVGRKGRMPV
ncbi:cytochrome P450 [Gonapodya prolifera JEL478]|uniref:Cytochrome P450 n=1 Tax=Gonapodya prolifera (strain JEL478) TaxID=1344416 RepID=A0A139A1K6_GONPJ|nr:cytochrome P450 [Gonapodya prolifera JEL478]|eukprot:KXS10619.1 cytochrome P450 [Gonapodya prolifera JEL478]